MSGFNDSAQTRIEAFALRNRLKVRTSADGTQVIQGRFGEIYQYDGKRLAVMVMPNPPLPRYWSRIRTVLIASGFAVVQNADGEGAAAFDPTNGQQAKLAIRAARVRHKREISAQRRQQLIASLRPRTGRPLADAGAA